MEQAAMSRKALTTSITLPDTTSGNRAPVAAAKGWPRRVWQMLLTWQERASARAQLERLDAHLRRDIGVTWEDVRREQRKPFWLP